MKKNGREDEFLRQIVSSNRQPLLFNGEGNFFPCLQNCHSLVFTGIVFINLLISKTFVHNFISFNPGLIILLF